MNKLLAFLNKYANLRDALIVTAFLFLIVVPINNRLTDSLYQLAHGVPKLDYQKTYDVGLVSQLFDAYGKQGRTMFAWDLIVDTFYPLAVAGAAMLFALTVVRKPILQILLIAIPMIFLVTDVIENVFFLLFIAMDPSISPILVGTANLFTRIKLFTIYPTFYEMIIFMPIAVILAIVSFARRKLSTRSITA
jgi:hypothetical protein